LFSLPLSLSLAGRWEVREKERKREK